MGETLCTLSSAMRLIGLLDYEREWLLEEYNYERPHAPLMG